MMKGNLVPKITQPTNDGRENKEKKNKNIKQKHKIKMIKVNDI